MTNPENISLAKTDALLFLELLFAGAHSGHAVVWSNFGADTYAYNIDNLPEAAIKLQSLANRGDTYIGRGLQFDDPSPRSRGKQETVCFVGGLFIDIDTLEGPHGGKNNPTVPLNLPKDMDEALKLLSDSGCPEFTAVIHTGGGIHVHWFFIDPEMLMTNEQRQAEIDFSRHVQSAVREIFAAAGFTLDGTADLSRNCKVPGTFNHKTSPPKPVKLISVGDRVDRTNIQNWLNNRPMTNVKAIVARNSAFSSDLISRIAYTESQRVKKSGVIEDLLSSIIAGCSFIEHAILDADRLPEVEWYSMIGIIARTVLGREWAHECSKAYPSYDVEETDAKIDHALADAGPSTCQHIADRIGFGGCVRCPFRASIQSPMNLAKYPLQLVKAQREHIFVVKGQMYLDLSTGDTLKISEFSDSIQHLIGEGPHSRMMSSSTTPKVRLAEYRAGDDRLIFNSSRGLIVNLWKKDGAKPKQGDFEVIDRFFQRFIPDAASRMHIVLYLAHLLQFPTIKITHGIIITGDQGTGKSSFYLLIGKLFGSENARKLEGEELGSRFNSRLVDTQVLLVEEAQHGERLETYEKLKEVITAEIFSAERKHHDVAPGYTPRGTFISSNHIAPIALPQNDRRWFVARTCDRPETPDEVAAHIAFFEKLHDAIHLNDDAISAFAHHLQTLDLVSFRPNAPPPMTVAKEVATENSRTPLANILNELILQASYPLHKDIVSMRDLQHALNLSEWSASTATPQKMAQALKSLGLKQVNLDADNKHLELVLPDRSKIRPWAIRDVNRWSKADREALKVELMRSDTGLFLYGQDEDSALIKLAT